MTDQKRPYRMTRRAELEQRTRQRITESAVELHGTIGPARTTIRALAQHAGVRRSTVYRHFPNELALFTACTSHWLAANPLPDIAQWDRITPASERLRTALAELYGYYRRTEAMMTNILRDEATVPVLTQMLAGYRQYLAVAREVLLRDRTAEGPARRRIHAAIGHALAFATWRSLAIEQGLDEAEIVGMMARLVAAAGEDPSAEAGAERPAPVQAR